jgi:demethylmenaquinone methyltransferase/2-methoxy-6-polyprenyl-1,4-benzoquinol methylase
MSPRIGLVPPVDAKELFAPLGPSYDRVGAALSLGQDPLWRRFLASRLPPGGHVLDVATGTGLVAEELLKRGFRVTGLDQSPDMLAIARRRFGDRVELVEASADALPFPTSPSTI